MKLEYSFLVLLFSFCAILTHAQDTSFYDIGTVHEINIDFDNEFWENKLKVYKKQYRKKRVSASLTVNDIKYDSVGVRFKGNSSFFSTLKKDKKKLPFNIDSDEYIKGQKFLSGIEKIKLSNIFGDPSYVREALAYRIARDYMIAPEANYAYLSIDDKPIGLYTSTEAIDKAFLKKHFGYHKRPFFKCDPEWHEAHPKDCKHGSNASLEYLGNNPLCYKPYYELKSKEESDWKSLIDLCSKLQKPGQVTDLINIDAVLWMHAFNAVFVNLDSYTGRFCHNYYLFQDSFGVFQPLIWDMNMAFGGFKFSDKVPLSTEDMQTMSLFIHVNNKERPLIKNILIEKENRLIYLDHVRTMWEDWIKSEAYLEEAKNIAKHIKAYTAKDINGLYDPNSFEKYISQAFKESGLNVPGLEELMSGRNDYIASHSMVNIIPPEILKSDYSLIADSVELSIELKSAESLKLYYRYEKGGPYLSATFENELSDSPWTISKKLSIKNVKEYYWVAFNDKAAKCYPSKAAFKPLSINTAGSL